MEALSRHWHVLVYLLGIVFVGGMVHANNESQDDKIAENKKEIQEEIKKVKEIDNRLTRIEANQKNQKDDIDEIKDDVKEILRELRDPG